jgi:hypothetical protein
MSTTADYPGAPIGGLLASEARRLWHRRVVRWLFLAAAAIYLLVFVLNYLHSNRSGQIDGTRPTFNLDGNTQDGAIAVGVGMAIIMFAVGTTYAGAEWTQRTIVALLFWEPRRLRVTVAKVAVAAAAGVVVTLVTQAIWLASAFFWATTRGDSTRSSSFWSQLLSAQLRVLVFVVLVTLLGFGIANLIRNSAASFGAGFVYFAILEFVVRAFRPHWNQWLLTENANALLSRGGADVVLSNHNDSTTHLSNLHGGLVWAVVAGVVIAIGAVLFARRDAT